MSDARSKLADALAQAKTKRVSGGTSAPAPKPATRASKPAKNTPPPSKPSAKTTKPAPKKQKAPKPKKTKSGSSGAVFKSFSKFANNMLDELKTATSEISPAALFNTATDSLQSIKKAVGFDGEQNPLPEGAERTRPDTDQVSSETGETQAKAPQSSNGASSAPHQATPSANNIPPSGNPSAPPAGPMTSPAKVQRMASKKKKSPDESAPQSPEEPSQEDLLKQLSGDSPMAETPQAPSGPADAPGSQPNTSPAKVQRVASKKKTEISESGDDEPSQEDLLDQRESGNIEPAPKDEPLSEPSHVEHAPAEESSTDTPGAPSTDTSKPEVSSEAPSDASESTNNPSEAKKKAPPKQQSPAVLSKTEHAIRSFHALHTLLNNERWAPIINSPDMKPSSLYAPREQFDTNFSDPVFRAGLKAASRLASSFGFEPEKMRFNQKLIDQIKTFQVDPEQKIKPHTENISSAIGEEKTKEIMGIYHNKNFKHLLFSVSTRMGSFVPTIESLARIYLSLRKKDPLSSGQRLQIQEEILMRYKKAPYSEAMGKKARNLAMNYFMDYLSNYALKLYKERFKDAPEGQDNLESYQRRHATIKTFCCDMIEEWAKKVALSSQAITTIQAKFIEQADQHLVEVTEN